MEPGLRAGYSLYIRRHWQVLLNGAAVIETEVFVVNQASIEAAADGPAVGEISGIIRRLSRLCGHQSPPIYHPADRLLR